jgi:hypothetical protein
VKEKFGIEQCFTDDTGDNHLEDIEYFLMNGVVMTVIQQKPGELIIYKRNVIHFVITAVDTVKFSTNFASKKSFT